MSDYLQHAKVYDRQKAHEYYLRTRKLKGRARGSSLASSQPNDVRSKVMSNIGGRKMAAEEANNTQSAHEAAKVRLEKLQARLDRLKTILEAKIEEAKKRAGVDEKPAKKASSSSTSTSGSSKTSSSTSGKKTTAELLAESKASREYYDKNKDKIKAKREQSVDSQIRTVQEQIQQIRAELKAVVKAARPKTNTATDKTKPRTAAESVRRK